MSIRVFLVDDHAVLRDGLRCLLGAEPDIIVVGDAADGRDAVRQVADLCPDVVIMDIVMPELNGIEATQELLELCPSTQVIILSMYFTTEHISRALRAGAHGYLLKEAAGIEVVSAIHTVHAGRLYLSQRISDEFLHQNDAIIASSPLERLSPRERQVLQLVVEGGSSAEIADRLFLSPKTVDTYRSRLMAKLGLKNLPALVKFAIQHGLTPPS